MIALGPIVERLTKAGLPRVAGVLEYSALENAPAQLPALFVVPVDEVAAPNRLSGVIDQRVTAQFQVVVVVAAQAARSVRPAEDLTEIVNKINASLIGWTMPDTSCPIEYAGGRLLSAGGREAVWAARFRTAYHERTQAQ